MNWEYLSSELATRYRSDPKLPSICNFSSYHYSPRPMAIQSCLVHVFLLLQREIWNKHYPAAKTVSAVLLSPPSCDCTYFLKGNMYLERSCLDRKVDLVLSNHTVSVQQEAAPLHGMRVRRMKKSSMVISAVACDSGSANLNRRQSISVRTCIFASENCCPI